MIEQPDMPDDLLKQLSQQFVLQKYGTDVARRVFGAKFVEPASEPDRWATIAMIKKVKAKPALRNKCTAAVLERMKDELLRIELRADALKRRIARYERELARGT